MPGRSLRIAFPAAVAVVGALAASAVAGATPSGQPVPRWESLESDRVNGRAGPTLEHPVLWEYRRRGLPVRVIAETRNWRQVIDPDGDRVWIRADLLSPRRTAIAADPRAALRRAPRPDAPILAKVEPGVVFTIADCTDGWLRVEAPRAAGWVRADQLWGGDCGG